MSGVNSQVLGRLVRRGVEATTEFQNGEVKIDMPAWALAIVGTTVALFVLLFVSINYTLGHVITTLTMVETPMNDLTIHATSAPSNDPDAPFEEKANLLDVEEAVTTIKTKPITSKIRSAIRHLHMTAGFTSRWRGLQYGVAYTVAFGILNNIVRAILPVPFVSSIVAAVALVPLHCAWTHATIAMPSSKRMKDRVTPRTTFCKLWAPAAMKAVAVDLSLVTIVAISQAPRLATPSLQTEPWFVVLTTAFTLVSATVVGLFVVLPVTSAFTRVEASLLPDDDETIVPFDRTLGGHLEPALFGGSASGTMKAALKSFDGESRRRLAKLVVKTFLIFTTLALVSVHIVGLELWLLPGNAVVLMQNQFAPMLPKF